MEPVWQEFDKRRAGVRYALAGGLWLHRWSLDGRRMAHLVSSDQAALLAWGSAHGMDARWIQYKPLKDPDTGKRQPCWHWDLFDEAIPVKRADG